MREILKGTGVYRCEVCELRPVSGSCLCGVCSRAFDRWNRKAEGTHAALIAWAAQRARYFERKRLSKKKK